MATIQQEYKGFLKYLVLFTLIIAAICWVLRFYAVLNLELRWMVILILLFALMSAVLHKMLLKVSEKRPQQFINTFMGITGAKLFALFMVIIIILLVGKSETPKTSLIILFCGLYLFYTAFEVVHLLRALDRLSKKKE